MIGVREPGWDHYGDYKAEILGYNYFDLENADVEGNPPPYFSACGDNTMTMRCTFECYLMDPAALGGEVEDTVPFVIDPIPAAIDEYGDIDPSTQCP